MGRFVLIRIVAAAGATLVAVPSAPPAFGQSSPARLGVTLSGLWPVTRSAARAPATADHTPGDEAQSRKCIPFTGFLPTEP